MEEPNKTNEKHKTVTNHHPPSQDVGRAALNVPHSKYSTSVGTSVGRKLYLIISIGAFYVLWNNILGDFQQKYGRKNATLGQAVEKVTLRIIHLFQKNSATQSVALEFVIFWLSMLLTIKQESIRNGLPVLPIYTLLSIGSPASVFPLFLVALMLETSDSLVAQVGRPTLYTGLSFPWVTPLASIVSGLSFAYVAVFLPTTTDQYSVILGGTFTTMLIMLFLDSFLRGSKSGDFNKQGTNNISFLYKLLAIAALLVMILRLWTMYQLSVGQLDLYKDIMGPFYMADGNNSSNDNSGHVAVSSVVRGRALMIQGFLAQISVLAFCTIVFMCNDPLCKNVSLELKLLLVAFFPLSPVFGFILYNELRLPAPTQPGIKWLAVEECAVHGTHSHQRHQQPPENVNEKKTQ